MTESTADAGAVAPDHLSEMSPSCVVMGVIIGVLGLFLMPAVCSSTRELDPGIVSVRCRVHRGEVTARAFLALLAPALSFKAAATYMLRVMCAFLNVSPRGISKLSVPNKVLGAMQLAPVPVSPHNGTDEVGVVLVGSIICSKTAALDAMCWRSDCSGRSESDECGVYLHFKILRR